MFINFVLISALVGSVVNASVLGKPRDVMNECAEVAGINATYYANDDGTSYINLNLPEIEGDDYEPGMVYDHMLSCMSNGGYLKVWLTKHNFTYALTEKTRNKMSKYGVVLDDNNYDGWDGYDASSQYDASLHKRGSTSNVRFDIYTCDFDFFDGICTKSTRYLPTPGQCVHHNGPAHKYRVRNIGNAVSMYYISEYNNCEPRRTVSGHINPDNEFTKWFFTTRSMKHELA